MTAEELGHAIKNVASIVDAYAADHTDDELETLGWALVNAQGETPEISLVRCVGSWIVHKRMGDRWKARSNNE